jgi:hypothetical protein
VGYCCPSGLEKTLCKLDIYFGSTEWRYFKVDSSMDKKWDTVVPADLKRLFVSGTDMFVQRNRDTSR